MRPYRQQSPALYPHSQLRNRVVYGARRRMKGTRMQAGNHEPQKHPSKNRFLLWYPRIFEIAGKHVRSTWESTEHCLDAATKTTSINSSSVPSISRRRIRPSRGLPRRENVDGREGQRRDRPAGTGAAEGVGGGRHREANTANRLRIRSDSP